MSKVVKVVLIVSGAFLCLGCILFGIGLLFRNNSESVLDTINRNLSYTSDDISLVEGSIPLEEFDKLNLKYSSIAVTLQQGNEYKLEYKVPEKYIPIVKSNGDTLSVTQPDVKQNFNISIGIKEKAWEYVITVPSDEKVYDVNVVFSSGDFCDSSVDISGLIKLSSGDVTLSHIGFDGSLQMTSGDTSMSDITAESLDIDISSGDVEIENSDIKNLNYKATSGKFSAYNLKSENIKTDISSGKIEIVNSNAYSVYHKETSGEYSAQINGLNDFTFNVTSGSLELETDRKEADFGYDISRTSGSLEVGGRGIDGSYIVNPDSESFIKGKVTSGAAEISFK